MRRYEYKRVPFTVSEVLPPGEAPPDYRTQEEKLLLLNALGDEGWQLVCLDGYGAYLEREKE